MNAADKARAALDGVLELSPESPLGVVIRNDHASALTSHERELRAAVRELLAEYERASDILQDMADHGLRFDLNPTLMVTTADEVYAQWAAYALRMDKSVRDRARQALAPAEGVS